MISLIIPCYRDEVHLQALLHQVKTLAHANELLHEVLVVDGADSAMCQQICADFNVQYVPSAKGRGVQQRTGAQIASAPILWFVHTDAQLDRQSLLAIQQDATAVGGYFKFQFYPSPSPIARFWAQCIQWRTYFGVPYGDQGLFFRREHYWLAGGHATHPLFEEVALIKRCRKMGTFVPLRLPIGVHTRRWQQDGWFKRTLHNRLLALGYACGIAPERLAARYHTQHKKD